MASKRSLVKQEKQAREDMAARLAAIEKNQRLIMAALEIQSAPDNSDDSSDAYKTMTVAELEDEAKERGIFDTIVGSGKDGNVIKADLIHALNDDDYRLLAGD